jgi:cell division protein FtsQ
VKPDPPRSQEEKNGRTSFWQTVAAAAFIIVVVALVVIANFWKSEITVDTVIVEGNRILTDREVLLLSGLSGGEQLFEVNLFKVRGRLLRNPFVRSASVTRDARGSIVLGVVERVPVAAIAGRLVWHVDEEGVVLPPAASDEIFDIPVITGDLRIGELEPGRKVHSARVIEALAWVKALETSDAMYRRVSEVHVLPDGAFALVMVEGGVPVYVGRQDHARKVLTLAVFWRQIVMQRDLRLLESVSLMYEGQVVAKWKNSGVTRGA